MRREKYNIIKAGTQRNIFEFTSTGKKGNIQKIIHYSRIGYGNLYNLSFGDKDEITGQMNDLSTSDNGDSKKVLATVAETILLFLQEYPDAWIYAEGSTPARTRLYQIEVARNISEIRKNFILFGLTEYGWAPFRLNINYKAFLVIRKRNKFTYGNNRKEKT